MATRILIIEDEPQIRENVAELLTLSGFAVDTAGDGQEGMLRAMLTRPDLIICDVMMPRMDGYQMLEVIRANRSLANVPFIFLTAKADITDVRRGMVLGADDYLAKPFTSRDLLASIESRLQREKIREAAVQAQLAKYRNELSRVSGHEYNTPLTGIMGFANLLTDYYDTFDKAETISMLEMISTCCLRLKRTLDNVRLADNLQQLTSHSPSPPLPAENIPLDSNRIGDIRRNLARRHEQAINCRIDVAPAQLAISGEYLNKVLDELMDNAFKFSLPTNEVAANEVAANEITSPEITVAGRRYETSYQLTITNRGRVFDARDIARIAPYAQFDRDLYEQQGSGLGLFIAKRLVEINHGSLTIQSQADGYTTVRVILPVLTTSRNIPTDTDGAVTSY